MLTSCDPHVTREKRLCLKLNCRLNYGLFLCNIQDIQIKIKIAYILLWKSNKRKSKACFGNKKSGFWFSLKFRCYDTLRWGSHMQRRFKLTQLSYWYFHHVLHVINILRSREWFEASISNAVAVIRSPNGLETVSDSVLSQ